MKVVVLLLASLLIASCGVEEPSGESKAVTEVAYENDADFGESGTSKTVKKVGKYAVSAVAVLGTVVCVTSGLKSKCYDVVKKTFIPDSKVADGVSKHSETFYNKLFRKIFKKKDGVAVDDATGAGKANAKTDVEDATVDAGTGKSGATTESAEETTEAKS